MSEPERLALRDIASVGLVDVLRQFGQPEETYSWWDYRMFAFRRNHGLRIDLILVSPASAARCSACSVDTEPRNEERPSDHSPAVATFDTRPEHRPKDRPANRPENR